MKDRRRCRICFEEDESVMPSPCACNAYVHMGCLQKWRRIRKLPHCEVCLKPVIEEAHLPAKRLVVYPLLIQRFNVQYPLHVYIGARLNEDIDWSLELEQQG